MKKIILNLTAKELAVYQAIIKHGRLSVSEISKYTGLKRTTIYNFIDNLFKKGLISRVIENGRKIYFPFGEKSAEIVNLEKKEINYNLKIFNTSYLIKMAIKKTLNSKNKQIYWIADSKTTTDLFGNLFFEKYIELAKEKNILMKTLRSTTTTAKHKYHSFEAVRKMGRIVRLGQSTARIHSTIIIYDNKVLIITSENNGLAYEISNSELSNSFKNIFNMLWKYSKVIGIDL